MICTSSHAVSRHDPQASCNVSSGVCTPGIHPDQIADVALQALIERDDEVDDVLRRARDGGEKFPQQRTRLFLNEIRRQLLIILARVDERIVRRRRIDKEVERIDDGHIGEEINRDAELGRPFGKDETRQPVSVRILLPVHEMLGRRDLERIARDPGAAVGRRPQANDMRTERDGTVVAVTRDVLEADQDRHADGLLFFCEWHFTIKQISGRRPWSSQGDASGRKRGNSAASVKPLAGFRRAD